MSDIYSILRSAADDSKATYNAVMAASSEGIEAPIPYQDLMEQIAGVKNPYSENNPTVDALIAQSKDPAAMREEWEAAKLYGSIYNVSPYSVFGHSNVFSEAYFGTPVRLKSAAKAVWDVTVAGTGSAIACINYMLAAVDRLSRSPSFKDEITGFFKWGLGNPETNIFKTLAKASAEVPGGEIDDKGNPILPFSSWGEQRLAAGDAAMAKVNALRDDPTPRGWMVKLMKWVGSSLPYMAIMGATGGTAGGVAGGLSSIAEKVGLDVTKKAAFRAFLADTVSFSTGALIMGGQDFATMREAGIDDKTAAAFCIGTGLLNSAVEQFLGLEGALRGVTAKAGIVSIPEYIARKAFVSGHFPSTAVRVLSRTGMSMITEPTEEGLQALISDSAQMIAQGLTESTNITDPMTADKMGKDIAENMWQAFVTAPFLGLAPSVALSIRDKQAAKSWAAAVPSMSKSSAVSMANEMGLLEDIPESRRAPIIEQAVDNIHERMALEASDRHQAALASVAEKAASGNEAGVARTEQGSLRTEAEVEADDPSVTTYTSGSSLSDEAYGSISIRDAGDHYVIEDADIAEGREGLAREMLAEATARLDPGKPVQLGEVGDPSIEEAYAFMGLGEATDTVTSEEDRAAAGRIRASADSAGFTSPAQREALVESMRMLAEATGKPLAEVARLWREDTLRADPSLAAKGKAGSISFVDETGKELPIREAARAAKAVVSLAENGNFAAVMHEFNHYARVILKDQPAMKKIEALYGIENGKWKKDHEERFAREFMAYQASGEAPTPEHKSVFRLMATWLKALWKGALGKLELAPEVKAAFDEMMSKEVPANEGEAQAAKDEGTVGETVVSPQAEVQPAAETAEPGAAKPAEPGTVVGQESSPVRQRKQKGKKAQTEAKQAVKDTAKLLKESDEVEFAGVDKSKGHVAFATSNDGKRKVEIYQAANGDVYVADLDNVIDLDTGNRIGRFESPAHGLDSVLKTWNIAHVEGQQYTLFMEGSELNDAVPYPMSKDMKDYATFEDWVSSIKGEISPVEEKFLRRQWDYEHSGAVKKFGKPGEFTKFLAAGDNFGKFIINLKDAISRSGTEILNTRRDRIQRNISRTPEIKAIVDSFQNGKAIDEEAKRKAIAFTRKNEAIVKFLYADAAGDVALADEAMSDLGKVPPLAKRQMGANPKMSLDEKHLIIEALSDAELVGKVKSKTATFKEMLAYSKRIESKAREQITTEKGKTKEAKAAAREAKRAASEKMAMARLRAHMRRLRAFILAAPTKGAMMAEEREALLYIKDYLSSDGDAAATALKHLGSIVFKTNPTLMRDTMAFMDSFKGRSFKDLSLGELEELADRVDAIAKAGRKGLKEERLTRTLHMKAERMRAAADIETTKNYNPDRKTPGSMEGEEENKRRERRFSLSMGSIQPPQFIAKYMGRGYNYDKLFTERIEHERDKFDNYDRRTRPVIEFIEKNRLQDVLFRGAEIEGVGVKDSALRVTMSELIGIRCLIGTEERFNKRQREAYIYGNLFDVEEKDVDEKRAKHEATDRWMEAKYKTKLAALIAATSGPKSLLTPELEKLADMIVETTDNEKDWTRFATAVLGISNREPRREKYYFPLMRQGNVQDGEDTILDALKGGGFERFLETGFTLDRARKIAPHNHKPVKVDSMQVFFDSVMKQEHLVNMGSYARELHSIYTMTDEVRSRVTGSIGKDGWEYLRNYIDEITAPQAWKAHNPGDKLAGMFRGAQVVGNLAWRLSSFLMQMATSPLPFYFEAPGEMLKVTAEAWTHNPIEWYKGIEEKSGVLRHRQFEPMQIALERLGEQGILGALSRFDQKGMNFLQFADRFSCAMGWEACYRKKMRSLAESKLDPAEMERQAKDYADEVVKKTQPSAEDIDRSPIYQDMTPWKQMLLQFTQPLNVIWNNVVYDAPDAWNNHERGKAIGIITCYAVTGLIVGATQALRGNGPAGDDGEPADADAWLKFFLAAGLGQFLEMIPLGGDIAASTLEAFLGNGAMPFRSDNSLPMLNEASKALVSVPRIAARWEEMDDDERKSSLQTSGWHAIKMMGYAVGAPVGALKEYFDQATRIYKAARGE